MYNSFKKDMQLETLFREHFMYPFYYSFFKDRCKIIDNIEMQYKGVDVIIDNTRLIDEKFSITVGLGMPHPKTYMFELYIPENTDRYNNHINEHIGWKLNKNKITTEYFFISVSKWSGPLNNNMPDLRNLNSEQIVNYIDEVFVMREEVAVVNDYLVQLLKVNNYKQVKNILIGESIKASDPNIPSGFIRKYDNNVRLVKSKRDEKAIVLVVPYEEHLKIATEMFYIGRNNGLGGVRQINDRH